MSSIATVTPDARCAYDWNRHWIALRILAAFEIILIAATFPLWWGNHSFPRIPLVSGLELPVSVDRLLSCILVAACVSVVGSNGKLPRDTVIRNVALIASISLCVLNQQRFQAWHWMFVLGLGTSFLRQEHRLRLLQSVLATVYVCSSLSRIAPMAYEGMSAAILDTLLTMTRIRRDVIPGSINEFLCRAANIGELAIGVSLIWPRLRRCGILLAVVLHLTLLIALGPFGLRHHPAVLIWNMCFLCLIPVVFSSAVSDKCLPGSRQAWNFRMATAVIWLFPLSGLIGIADNWPAWQIYSPRPESWILQIHERDVTFLAEDIQQHVTEPMPLDDWVVVKLDRWSLVETESPLYPEGRFQRDVIQHVLSTLPDDVEFRVDISEPAPWFWWKRIHRTLSSRNALDAE